MRFLRNTRQPAFRKLKIRESYPIARRWKASLCAALFLVICLVSNPGFAQVITLDSVLNTIEINNTMLKMYDEQLNAMSNYASGAKSWEPPKFLTGPWQTPYNNFQGGMWMITAEQMIPNPSRQKANSNYMQSLLSSEQQRRISERNKLFSAAKKNYYSQVVLQKQYSVLLQADSTLSYISDLAQARYAYNKEKLNNIYKIKAELFELRNSETVVDGNIRSKNVELNTLMNEPEHRFFSVDTTQVAIHDYELQPADTTLISKSRSDIRQFDATISVLLLRQELEKAKGLPEFGVSLSHMQSLGNMPNQYSAMGMFTLPIAPWSSKEYKSTVRGLDNEAKAISYQRSALINETSGMIRSIQSEIRTVKTQLNNYKDQIIPAYQNSYKTSLLAYEQNTEDLFVVLDAIRMYRMAKMSELELLNTLLGLQADYEKELEIH